MNFNLLKMEVEANHTIYNDFPHLRELTTIKKDGLILKYRKVFLDNVWTDILWTVTKTNRQCSGLPHNIYISSRSGRRLELKEWAILYNLNLAAFRKLLSEGLTLEKAIETCPRGFDPKSVKNPFRPAYSYLMED